MSTTWRVSRRGVAIVARLELKQRVRTSRWPVVLGLWVLVIGGVSSLTWWAVHDEASRGVTLYGVVLFFVLALALLVVPSLTATSVNGDREHGVLATLQVTLLSPAEIALGKLVAAVVTALVFLAAALPFLLWAMLAGGASVGRMTFALAVLVAVVVAVCALGMGVSAWAARTVTSVVLTYLTVATLTVGTVISFLLTAPVLSQEYVATVNRVPQEFYEQNQGQDGAFVEPTRDDCRVEQEVRTVWRTDRAWWLLAANPFVVVADAVPLRRASGPDSVAAFDPLDQISAGVRYARRGPQIERVVDECFASFGGDVGTSPEDERDELRDIAAVWPWGLGIELLLGAGAVTLAVRRLRAPVRTLPRGTRVA